MDLNLKTMNLAIYYGKVNLWQFKDWKKPSASIAQHRASIMSPPSSPTGDYELIDFEHTLGLLSPQTLFLHLSSLFRIK